AIQIQLKAIDRDGAIREMVALLVASGGLDKLASDEVTAALEARQPPTAILGLLVGRGLDTRVTFAEQKRFAFDAALARAGEPNVRAEIFSSDGRLLGAGEAQVELCRCDAIETHYDGDVERPHETVAMVKVPWVDGSERLRVTRLDPAGAWRVVLEAPLFGGDR
ncbi:MAG: hypothetical protein ACK4N5_24225, partial [Myxococcales bacterium]